MADQEAALRRRRRLAGMCLLCGQHPPVAGAQVCASCHEQHGDLLPDLIEPPAMPDDPAAPPNEEEVDSDYIGSSSLINSKSGLTYRHERYLSMLVEWTFERPFIRAVLESRSSTPDALKGLAVALRLTLDGDRDPKTMIGEREAAAAVLHFLDVKIIRTTVAKLVVARCTDPLRAIDKTQVLRDLYALRASIRAHYQLAEGEPLKPKTPIEVVGRA